MKQLDLFAHLESPTWEDVQQGRAKWIQHDPYSKPCYSECLWSDCIFELCGKTTCYLFRKPIVNGMCPSSGQAEWID